MINIMFSVAGKTLSRDTPADIGEGALMPYPAGHRIEVKRKIVQSARRLFNRHGFDNVSLAQIMADAGLTHGGFYSYFNSKNDLYAEVLRCFFTDPDWKSCWEGVKIDLAAADVAPQIVRAYLSKEHFENIEKSCPMVALPSYVARSNKRAKDAFEKVFRAMVHVLERGLVTHRCSRHTTAQAVAALCVGGMVVARATVNREFADDLRDACMTVALRLSGWKGNRASKKRMPIRPVRSGRGKNTRSRQGTSSSILSI